VEVIAVLVIAGIAASMAGMGILQSVETLAFSRRTATLFQESDFLLKRLSRELRCCWQISATGNYPGYQTYRPAPDTGGFLYTGKTTLAEYRSYTFWFTSPSGKLADFSSPPCNSSNKDLWLLNGVQRYGTGETFVNVVGYDGTSWDSSKPMSALAGARILLPLQQPQDAAGTLKFAVTVAFRNNGVPNMPVPQ
jgi:hypothetical protein